MTDTTGLDRLIDKVRRVKGFLASAAPVAAEAVAETLRTSAAAGRSPSGETWAPRKDGGRPLENAASKINVRAVGTAIVAAIAKPESIHNAGTKKDPKRQILPDAMTPDIAAAIGDALSKAWEASK